jgi:hypothetical protein
MLIFSKLTFNRHDGKYSLVTSPKRGDAECHGQDVTARDST